MKALQSNLAKSILKDKKSNEALKKFLQSGKSQPIIIENHNTSFTPFFASKAKTKKQLQ